jgi:hypothetical protein
VATQGTLRRRWISLVVLPLVALALSALLVSTADANQSPESAADPVVTVEQRDAVSAAGATADSGSGESRALPDIVLISLAALAIVLLVRQRRQHLPPIEV